MRPESRSEEESPAPTEQKESREEKRYRMVLGFLALVKDNAIG